MKKYNLKPLYIFLVIFCAGWVVKLTTKAKQIEGTVITIDKDSKYVNTFEEQMHESAADIKKGIAQIQKEALERDSIAIIPMYNN